MGLLTSMCPISSVVRDWRRMLRFFDPINMGVRKWQPNDVWQVDKWDYKKITGFWWSNK